MDGVLFIPYVNTDLDDDRFVYKGTPFDYIGELNNVSSNIVGAENYDQYIQGNRSKNTVGFNVNLNNQNNQVEEQILFYELPCKFMDSEEKDENIDNLINYFKTEESFMMIFSFDQDSVDEDVLIELKSWVVESKKVMSMPSDVYSEDIKIGLLPKRQFKFMSGKANAYLNDCILFDTYDDKIAIFVNKIIFYN